MREASYWLFYPFYVVELAAALGSIGRVDDGLSELETALALAAEIDYQWIVPEMLRAKGELLAPHGAKNIAATEDLFRQSMSQARDQRALYWELCTAASYGRLLRHQQRDAEARSVLLPVYDRLTEGHSTSRIRQIRALVDQMI